MTLESYGLASLRSGGPEPGGSQGYLSAPSPVSLSVHCKRSACPFYIIGVHMLHLSTQSEATSPRYHEMAANRWDSVGAAPD